MKIYLIKDDKGKSKYIWQGNDDQKCIIPQEWSMTELESVNWENLTASPQKNLP